MITLFLLCCEIVGRKVEAFATKSSFYYMTSNSSYYELKGRFLLNKLLTEDICVDFVVKFHLKKSLV